MINIISKHKEHLKSAIVLAVSILLVLMLRMFAIPLLLYFLVMQRVKFKRFCDIYDDPELRKHSPRIMFISLIKYLAVVFIMTTVITAPYGVAVILAPLIVATLMMIVQIAQYFKLWKYHGYSVIMLTILSGVAITLSVFLSPFVRAIMWLILAFFVGIPMV